MAEGKKRVPVHEVIIMLLAKTDRPELCEARLTTFLEIYLVGTIVPVKAIPDLIDAFQKAFDSAPKTMKPGIVHPGALKGMLDTAIHELDRQLIEVKEKEEKAAQESETV